MAGRNVIVTEKQQSIVRVFLKQFCDLLVLILILVALISMLSGGTENAVVIFIVILLNAILGTV